MGGGKRGKEEGEREGGGEGEVGGRRGIEGGEGKDVGRRGKRGGGVSASVARGNQATERRRCSPVKQ